MFGSKVAQKTVAANEGPRAVRTRNGRLPDMSEIMDFQRLLQREALAANVAIVFCHGTGIRYFGQLFMFVVLDSVVILQPPALLVVAVTQGAAVDVIAG